MPTQYQSPPWHERLLRLSATVRPGEGRCVMFFFGYAFLLLVCYYILKTLREPLLLVEASPEIKSYAYAAVALVLLVGVPVYAEIFKRISRVKISYWVTAFFIANLIAFHVLARAGVDIGFAYYVWVGVFGVTMIAQFWAHAADSFNVQSGQRLFPAIMAAAALGGLVGPTLVASLFAALGPWPLLWIAIGLLTVTLPLIGLSREAVPELSRYVDSTPELDFGRGLSGFGLVFRDRYLLLLAGLIVLLNCVNTTGEYLLTDLVVRYASEQSAIDPTRDAGDIIAAFYGSYYLAVNLLAAVAQLFIVGRLFRWIGVQGAILILPVIALIGYGLVVFVPVFSVLRLVKIFENSADYSVMNTSRQALYLPLSAAAKYEGKIAVDTFFYRFGDLLQAGIIYAGLHIFGFAFEHFALLNACLAVVWLSIAIQLAKRYAALTSPREPQLGRIRDLVLGIARPALRMYRNFAALLLTATLGVVALTASAPAEAGEAYLFDEQTVLEMAFALDLKALCRNPGRKHCRDEPVTIEYEGSDGQRVRVTGTVRSRGRYREDTGDCQLPALFVFFDEASTAGSLFAGQTMLPLTTHCQPFKEEYEDYVLKEYLAYRIYNLLTDKSLRVRLARLTYHDTSGKYDPLTAYGFFTEHFDSLARRHGAVVVEPEQWDPREANPEELAIHDVFQYLIGNTDWSVIYGHNIVHIEQADGSVTAVPYDFDFSGLVNTEYAGPPPQLRIRSVRQRIYRGFCFDDVDWNALAARVLDTKAPIEELTRSLFPDADDERSDVTEFLLDAFDIAASSSRFTDEVHNECRRL